MASTRPRHAHASRHSRTTRAGLEAEFAEIRRTAADVLAINRQNKELREQLAAEEIRVATLEQENRALTSQTTRYWFMSGALVLVIGMVLGLMAATDSVAAPFALRPILSLVRLDGLAGQEKPGLDDAVRVQGHALDTLVQQPACKVRMI